MQENAIPQSDIEAEIKSFPFFIGFPPGSLSALSQMFTAQEYESGSYVLKQGQPNSALYFLRHGELDVLVDDERVTTLTTPGEVLGEMSLINKTEVKASVRAVKKTYVFVIEESNFSNLPDKNQQNFRFLLNQVLNQVLVLRLDKTNERAKKFENTNKELQKTQDEIKELNRTLENEIRRRSQELVDKVKNISETILSVTTQQMSQTMQEPDKPVDVDKLRLWSNNINEAVELLKPVIDLSEKKGGNHFRRVGLCTASKKQQNIAKLALGGTGVSLDVFSEGIELQTELKIALPDLVLIDASLESTIREIRQEWPQLPVVIMVEDEVTSFINLIKNFPDQPYFVSRKPENRNLTIKSLTTTVAKILNNDLFGLDKYLSSGAQVLEYIITNSHERQDQIEKMKNHFGSFGIRSTILDQIGLVTEEMLMNAIYDAPVESSGTPLYNHLSRTQVINLSGDQAVKLRFGTDGVFVGVSVTDPCGSLSKETIQNYLEKNFLGVETAMVGKGGAGKGLYMIIMNSDFVVFNVKPFKRTEVIAFFQLERAKDEVFRPALHLFF